MIDRSKLFNGFIAAILVVAAFYIGKSCNCGHGSMVKWVPIRVRHDTTITKYLTSVSYVPVPYKVEVPKEVQIPVATEPQYQYLPLDSFPPIVKQWITDYNSKKYYDTTIGIKYGGIRITDSLYKNSIIGRSIIVHQDIPEITNTITIAQQPRTTMYVGLGLIGNKTNTLFMGEVNAGLLLKNRKYYGIGALLDKNGTIYYEGKMMFPITFRK